MKKWVPCFAPHWLGPKTTLCRELLMQDHLVKSHAAASPGLEGLKAKGEEGGSIGDVVDSVGSADEAREDG
jgi:hypothetical protein